MEMGVGPGSARCEGRTNRRALSRRSFEVEKTSIWLEGGVLDAKLTCHTKGKVLMSVTITATIVIFHAKDMCRTSSRNIVMSEEKTW